MKPLSLLPSKVKDGIFQVQHFLGFPVWTCSAPQFRRLLESTTSYNRRRCYINPETLEPHPHFKPAEAEVVLNGDGNITAIKLLSAGEYYFDPDFGIGVDDSAPPDSLFKTIFDWNYITEPDTPHKIFLTYAGY